MNSELFQISVNHIHSDFSKSENKHKQEWNHPLDSIYLKTYAKRLISHNTILIKWYKWEWIHAKQSTAPGGVVYWKEAMKVLQVVEPLMQAWTLLVYKGYNFVTQRI